MKELFTIIFSAAVAVLVSLAAQSLFMSKYEENSLIQALIPSLTSEKPRKIDLGLLLLKETVSVEKYEALKKIIDTKVGEKIEESLSSEQSKLGIKKRLFPPKENKENNKDVAYAKQRDDWKKIAKAKIDKSVKKMSKDEFYDYLKILDIQTSDKVLDQILIVAAKEINNNNYFKAYVAADWVSRVVGYDRYKFLLGLSNVAPKNQGEMIKKYYLTERYEVLQKMYWLKAIVRFDRETPETEGEMVDSKNLNFLEDLKKEKQFENLLNPKPSENKFKKIK